jgi:hypothetical protein
MSWGQAFDWFLLLGGIVCLALVAAICFGNGNWGLGLLVFAYGVYRMATLGASRG